MTELGNCVARGGGWGWQFTGGKNVYIKNFMDFFIIVFIINIQLSILIVLDC